MLTKILAISGKPGLYRLISRGKRTLIVEALDPSHKRMPAFGADKIISLGDVSMYTDAGDVPLRDVLKAISQQQQGQALDIDHKGATSAELASFMSQALPDYDRDRVHASDIRKLIQWYNILVANGITDFEEALPETQGDNIQE